jgi:hypothetical protein
MKMILLFVIACGSASSSTKSDGAAASNDGQRAALDETLGTLTRAAGAFEMEHGRCVQSIEDVASPAPKDPWGNDVAFMPASEENPKSAFVSAGADGQLLTEDDVTATVHCSSR